MSLFFHLVASPLTLLSLGLLLSVPWTVTSATLSSQRSQSFQPSQRRQAPVGVYRQEWWERDRGPGGEEQEEHKLLLRAQGGPLVSQWPWLLPRGRSRHTRHYQERGQGEEGGKRNEALTSIAGGLNAASREKGGFGFRFGRKRWSGRRRTEVEEDEWE